ncbi:hypothetical protein WJ968_08165 [Achromobacter xylosoxidans]
MIGKIALGVDSKLQAKGALRLDAGKALTLAGLAETNAGMTLASGTDLRVDGSAMAHGGAPVVDGGPGLTLGATGTCRPAACCKPRPAASCRRTARSRASRDIRLSSNADTVVNGKTVANGLEHQGRYRPRRGQERPGARQRQAVPLAGQTRASPAIYRHRRDSRRERRHAARRGLAATFS